MEPKIESDCFARIVSQDHQIGVVIDSDLLRLLQYNPTHQSFKSMDCKVKDEEKAQPRLLGTSIKCFATAAKVSASLCTTLIDPYMQRESDAPLRLSAP